MADTNEATRQHMEQEAAHKLVDVKSQESLFVFVSGVSPAERYLVILEGNEPVIGDRNSMSVGAEIAQHLIGSTERWLAVDHPSPCVKLTDQTAKQFGLIQAVKQAVKLELPGSVSLLERFEKLAAEDFTESPFGKKEPITSRTYPVGMVARKTTGSDDAVNVGMMLQLLIPGMENAEEADLGAEARGICGNFDESLCAAAEQQAVDQLLVL